jgi:peptidoglycan hydrolase CwlO-like protein
MTANLSKRTEYITAILAVLIPVITGTLWIGSVANTAQGAEQAVSELKTDLKHVPEDVAVLKQNVSDLKQTISEMRQEQQTSNAALLAAVKQAAKGGHQ